MVGHVWSIGSCCSRMIDIVGRKEEAMVGRGGGLSVSCVFGIRD